MKVCIVYYSATGNTKMVAEAAAEATGADLVEVKDRAGYSKVMMYLKGAPKARRGEKAEIEPAVIDVAAYDVVAIGTPVWAFRPTPAANAIVAALENCEGKKGIAFATSGGAPGEALQNLARQIEERGMTVTGTFHISDTEIKKGERLDGLARLISTASGA
ncbi:flavodoxin [uncultured Methanofollis sp.]|uniref:flavodoxin family protein n=1 Tax=uncultured Methanofollis sp. TaxID=262500 RepID=UPI00262C1CA4|nr:flavodoxin [uncultured Methanofollis sp.]